MPEGALARAATAGPRKFWDADITADGDHRAQYYADKRLSYPPDIEREPGREYVFRV